MLQTLSGLLAGSLATVLVVTGMPAQTTWIVDGAGGPGSHFTTINAGVAAASPGDVVSVRPGTYLESVDIDKGIRLIGSANASISAGILAPTIHVHDVPATESCAVVGFTIGLAGSNSTRMQCADCDGLVLLEQLTAAVPTGQGTPTLGLSITDSRQTIVNRVFFRGGIIVERSTVSITGSVLESLNAGGPLRVTDGDVTVDGATMSMQGIFLFAAPAYLNGGTLRIARSSVSNNGHPGALNGMNGVAAYAESGELTIDNQTTLNPGTGFPTTGSSPNGTITRRDFETARIRFSPLSIQFDYRGEPGAFFATLYSAPAPGLASPFGHIWVDPFAYYVLDVGQLDAAGEHTRQLPLVGLPTGLVVMAQPVFLTTAGVTFANASAFAAR